MKKIIAWFKSTVKGFNDNHCSVHAAGLTYFAVLALVPVICCILVIAKMAHVDQFARQQINAQIDAFITNIEKGQDDALVQFAPESEEERQKKKIAAEEFALQARHVSDQLFSRIEKFDIGTLGWVGFAFLLWTVISSLGQVEICFNEIWGVAKPRPIWKKAYLYLWLAVFLPIFAALAMSMPVLNVVKDVIVSTMGATWLTKWVSDGLIWILDSALFRYGVSFCIASFSFAFVFWVIPNCSIRFRHAWYGGMITAVLFGALLKACAVAQVGIAKSSALYGSFAFVPIVLAWFCMSWQVILLGANMVRSFEIVTVRKTDKEMEAKR